MTVQGWDDDEPGIGGNGVYDDVEGSEDEALRGPTKSLSGRLLARPAHRQRRRPRRHVHVSTTAGDGDNDGLTDCKREERSGPIQEGGQRRRRPQRRHRGRHHPHRPQQGRQRRRRPQRRHRGQHHPHRPEQGRQRRRRPQRRHRGQHHAHRPQQRRQRRRRSQRRQGEGARDRPEQGGHRRRRSQRRTRDHVRDDPLDNDSDNDGLLDGHDVEFVQHAVKALALDAFRSPGAGNRDALLSNLDEVESILLKGDTAGRGEELQNVRKHLDGCGAAGRRRRLDPRLRRPAPVRDPGRPADRQPRRLAAAEKPRDTEPRGLPPWGSALRWEPPEAYCRPVYRRAIGLALVLAVGCPAVAAAGSLIARSQWIGQVGSTASGAARPRRVWWRCRRRPPRCRCGSRRWATRRPTRG